MPLSAYGPRGADQAEAFLELNTGLAVEQPGKRSAVNAGTWPSFWQRPQTLIVGLSASAWHHARNFDACRKLEENFTTIQKEALEILRQDASGGARFASHDSKALAAGDWCDVGLYFNGMRNDVNAIRAPKTSALLCSDVGGLRQDCTSCPLGSAYFSLLRPHTWIAAHCGPTNARLRAHLSLIVPEGDCEIIVGGEARK